MMTTAINWNGGDIMDIVEIECPPLIDILLEIPDLRKAKGKRHPLPAILALACVATLCGYKGYRAFAEWGGNYVMIVKENQQKLLDDVMTVFHGPCSHLLKMSSEEIVDVGHGRLLLAVSSLLSQRWQWNLLGLQYRTEYRIGKIG
jgi:hypothetical protein